MNTLVPVTWKSSLDGLRDRLMNTFDRWLPAKARHEDDGEWDVWPDALSSSAGPLMDVEETEDEIRVAAEVPGLSEKDIQVELDGHRLVLRGEKKATREDRHGTCYYSECRYGSFYRAIPLPCEVEADKVNATCKNGVLRVNLPKTASAKAKRIPVTIH
jgi:HSP20 family protein